MTLTSTDIAHRQAYEQFAVTHAANWYKSHLSQLYSDWHEWNANFFGSKLIVPYILITDMHGARTMGDCSVFSGFGGKSQIRLRDTILSGTFGSMQHGTRDPKGCFRVIQDTLLHEMIHQFMQEVEEDAEPAWHGHGPLFRDHCNRIGDELGFLKVRTCKKRGADKELPSCSHWPHRKDAEDYYLGVYPSDDVETIKGTIKEALDSLPIESEAISELTEEGLTVTIPTEELNQTKALLIEARKKLSKANYAYLHQLIGKASK